MNDEKWSSASLRIYSKVLSAAEIGNLLGTAPHESHEKGSAVSQRPTSMARKESLWILKSELENSEPLEAHINNLVKYIEDKEFILRSLQLKCEIDLFCGFSSESGQYSFELDAEVLKKLTKLPITVIFDCYINELLRDKDD
jgi:hypothetical protein